MEIDSVIVRFLDSLLGIFWILSGIAMSTMFVCTFACFGEIKWAMNLYVCFVFFGEN